MEKKYTLSFGKLPPGGLPRNSAVRIPVHRDMTSTVYRGRKTLNQNYYIINVVISCNISYTPTAIMLARYVTHMNTQSPGGICYASLEVGWYSRYQPTSTKA